MFNRSRAMIVAALAAAFSPLAAAAQMIGAANNQFSNGTPARRSRARPGRSLKRGFKHPVTGKLVKFKRPAVAFVRNPDNGLHWEKGELVGPARGNASLYGKRGQLEPSKRTYAKARIRAPKVKHYPSPKAEARARRRNGEISARQQRKLRKVDPRLVAPTFYGIDLRIDRGQVDRTAMQSIGAAP